MEGYITKMMILSIELRLFQFWYDYKLKKDTNESYIPKSRSLYTELLISARHDYKSKKDTEDYVSSLFRELYS